MAAEGWGDSAIHANSRTDVKVTALNFLLMFIKTLKVIYNSTTLQSKGNDTINAQKYSVPQQDIVQHHKLSICFYCTGDWMTSKFSLRFVGCCTVCITGKKTVIGWRDNEKCCDISVSFVTWYYKFLKTRNVFFSHALMRYQLTCHYGLLQK